ncbi:MAG: tyrosine-type recombinase/integrase, partial [Clostridia bacterium]|nr:tyrosine-type recombinase/integrase [Clostridia bacterium]
MRVIKNRAERTVEQYENDIVLFLCFYRAKREGLPTSPEKHNDVDISGITVEYLSEVRPENIYEFLTYVANERGNNATARARKLTAIKSIFKYLTVTTHRLSNNPAKDIDSPHTKSALPKFLSLEESLELLNAVKEDKSSATKERDFAILTMFLNCGLRLSELCGINLNDIDREFTSLRVLGKGSKERMVYLNTACADALKTYIAVRAQDTQIKDKNALFISTRQHNRISKKTVQWLVKKYLGNAGLSQKHYSTHKLRHTAATLMYRTGKV